MISFEATHAAWYRTNLVDRIALVQLFNEIAKHFTEEELALRIAPLKEEVGAANITTAMDKLAEIEAEFLWEKAREDYAFYYFGLERIDLFSRTITNLQDYDSEFAASVMTDLSEYAITDKELSITRANLEAQKVLSETLLEIYEASDKAVVLQRLEISEGYLLDKLSKLDLDMTELRMICTSMDIVLEYEVNTNLAENVAV